MKNTSTVVKQFVVDFSSETYKPLMEHEVNGLDYRYVYSDKARLSVVVQGIENGSASLLDDKGELHAYYHCDYLGTTDYLTSAVNSKVISWTSYSEWGEITHNAVLKCGQRELDLVKEYATHDFDAVLNMYYAKARFYDADNRRFAAIDPILDPSQYDLRQYVTDPMQLVQYLYVKANAVNWIDPLGLEKIVVSGGHVKPYQVANFIEPAIRTIREWIEDGHEDESITWLIANQGYADDTGRFLVALAAVLNRTREDFPDSFSNSYITPTSDGLELTFKDGGISYQ